MIKKKRKNSSTAYNDGTAEEYSKNGGTTLEEMVEHNVQKESELSGWLGETYHKLDTSQECASIFSLI